MMSRMQCKSTNFRENQPPVSVSEGHKKQTPLFLTLPLFSIREFVQVSWPFLCTKVKAALFEQRPLAARLLRPPL